MRTLPLLAAVAAVPALLLAAPAGAQTISGYGGGPRTLLPGGQSHNFSWEGGRGFRRGFHGNFGGGVWVIEDDDPVVIEREVIREVPVEPAAAPAPPEPRKPYVLGRTYASLPGSCMKMIDEGTSYYYCGGEWYRQIAEGRSPLYKAVARP